MKRPLDLSISQRLTIGFGFILIVIAVFVGLTVHWHTRSANAQDALVQRIIPLGKQADALENSIFRVAVSVRSYLLAPSTERMQQYLHDTTRAREALQRLGDQPKEADGVALFQQIEPLVSTYLRDSNRIIDKAVANPGEERQLAATREMVIAQIRAFTNLQDRKHSVALSEVQNARENVATGLVIASILAALLFFVIARLTAKSVREPVERLLRITSALEAGDWKPALALARTNNREADAAHNEILQLGRAFGTAATALEQREQRIRADARVAAAAASSLDKEQIAKSALQQLVEHAHADVGVMYWRDQGSDLLQPIAQHALNEQIGSVRIGDGVPGLAARDYRTVVTRDIPRDTSFRIKLGYDEAPPRVVVAVPIVFREKLQGVLLVASLRDIDDNALSFLNGAGVQLGIGFQNVRAFEEIERLLADVSDKNLFIQAQNEELQAQNEEIQAQSEELQAQSEELQSQSEEIQAQNEELRQQTEELLDRTQQLSEAGERKNEFLGVLAHELRNPMAAITNSLMIAKRTTPGSAPSARAQAVIERQAQHLIRLVDDLLDITRISRGKIEIQRERLDLIKIVRDCIEDQRLSLEQKDLMLAVDLPKTPVWIDGDSARLCQIFGNLLNNALKFSDGDKQIDVILKADQKTRQVELRIVDRGIGIEPELLPRLFEPFMQGNVTLARSSGGLGLGLALVKTLVELHHGSVKVRSDGRGAGSEFIVRLPLQDAPATAKTVPLTKNASADTKRRRLLIVEDNADVALSLRELLELDGHEIAIARNGLEGIELAATFRPQAILCDIGLPDMDGYELVRRFRASKHLRDTLLIALSGYTSEADKKLAKQSGFDSHLAKPPNLDHLREVLAQIA